MWIIKKLYVMIVLKNYFGNVSYVVKVKIK